MPPCNEYSPRKLPLLNVAANGTNMVPEAELDGVIIVPVNVFCPKNTPLPVERLTMIVTMP